MTYLELVKALQEESGSGSSSIATLVGVSGEPLRLRNWIDTANLTIQSQWVDWKFLWNEATPITTGVDSSDYVGPEDLNVWDKQSFRIDGVPVPKTSVQEYLVKDFPVTNATGKPNRIFIMPNNQLRVYPTPDAAYTVTANYWRTPLSLKLDTDIDNATPLIPPQFHRVVINMALQLLGTWENAPEIVQTGREGLDLWWPLLVAHQAPEHQEGTMSSGNDLVIRPE